MAFQLSPGVAVTERDLTTIVPTVAVTNAGMAGIFPWGPVGKRIIVSSVQDLIANFGTPEDENYQWWFTAANFLGYGNNLTVVRYLKESTAKNATGTTNATNAVLLKDPVDADQISPTLCGELVARYPGTLGNSIRVEICGAQVIVEAEGAPDQAANTTYDSWAYKNEFTSVPGTSTHATGGYVTGNDEFHMVIIDVGGRLSGVKNSILEKYEGLSVIPGATNPDGTSLYYKTRLNASSKYVAVLGAEKSAATSLLRGLAVGTASSSAWTWNHTTNIYSTGGVYVGNFSGGAGEFPTDAADEIAWNTAIAAPSTVGGYNVLASADEVDINLLLAGPLSGVNAANVANIAKARMDCVAFVSTPNYNPTASAMDKIEECTTIRTAVGNNNYAFIDSGWKMMFDPFNDTNRWIPLNGDIAGLCARTDLTNDPWWSPAGFNRGQIRNVIKLAFSPTQTQRDEIYKVGVNPVVTFPGEGTVLYGDKTAQTKPSAFDRINVRRLFIVLEKSIAVAAKYSLFEFNDSFTRAQFKSMVEPFLRDVQARRGIIDFKVVCSEANNTSQVIDSNRFVADIYIKPNRSINYIQLNFIATKSGVSFEEVGA